MTTFAQFWNEFTTIQDQLEGPDPSSEAMDHLLSCLAKIDERLYFHLGSHDEGTDLILSAEGNADLMPVLNQLKEQAPKLKRWGVLAAFDGLLLFGERNEHVFPNTENGDVLYRMATNGDCLWIAREVNFSLVFPSQDDAKMFVSRLANDKYQCEISEYDGAEGYSFQAEVSTEIIPSHEVITSIESHLGQLAEEVSGRNDGWGCFEVKS